MFKTERTYKMHEQINDVRIYKNRPHKEGGNMVLYLLGTRSISTPDIDNVTPSGKSIFLYSVS